MIYVISDLHGCYDKFVRILDYINFSDVDSLYLLGDLCDRGPQSAELYMDIMSRKNIFCIMGNHEKMLLDTLPHTFGFLKLKKANQSTVDYEIWNACGGGETCVSLMNIGVDKTLLIYNYISSFPYYKIVKAGSKKFLLIHAGLENYSAHKPLSTYSADELVWGTLDYNKNYYPEQFEKIIVGHTPTFILDEHKPTSVFHGEGNVINIDCGAVFEKDGGRLACLCLNTMEEFYV